MVNRLEGKSRWVVPEMHLRGKEKLFGYEKKLAVETAVWENVTENLLKRTIKEFAN